MTPARKYALNWFADHDADPTSVLLRRAPSTKMHRLMRREGQLDKNWHLTELGQRLATRVDGKSVTSAETPARGANARAGSSIMP